MDTNIKELVLTAAKNLNTGNIDESEECIRFSVPLKDRQQYIFVTQPPSSKYITIISFVCRFQNLNPVAILRANASLEEGALAIIDFDLKDGLGVAPTLTMVTTQRIDTADVEEVESKIIAIAQLADVVEQEFEGSDRY